MNELVQKKNLWREKIAKILLKNNVDKTRAI